MARRYRVTIKTVVNVAQDIEADSYEEAIKKAEDGTDYYRLLYVANLGGVELTWAEEHAYAGVDCVGADGEYAPNDPVMFAPADDGWIRREE